jgi:hypothetical protein
MKRLLIPIALLLLPLAGAQDILLRTDRGAFAGGDVWPMGAGVPLKEGQAKDAAQIGIVSRMRGPLAVQCEARTRYPDGSIQWLWADFLGPVENSYRLVVSQQKQALGGMGVEVVNAGRNVIARNGALQVTWDTHYATPVKVEVATAGGAMRTVAEGRGDGVYVIDNTDKRCVLGGPAGALDFKIETQNKLRAVIRVEGWYVREDGEKVARAVMRYHLYWGQPWMRVEHSLIITRDNDEMWFKEVGVRFPLAAVGKANTTFGVDGKSASVPCDEAGGEAYVFQSKHPIYYRKESECIVGRGSKIVATAREAAGWADLSGGQCGLLVAVKDFAPQFPKELAANTRGVTAKLWSGRDGKVLDYRPATLVKDWWQDWADQVAKMDPKDVGRTKPMTVEELKAQNPSCVGVARTHELLVGYYLGAQDERRSRVWAERFQTPPVVYPDSAWTCHVDARTFWQMAAKGEFGAKHADLEEFITRWFDEFMVAQQLFPQSGWYDWMKLPYIRYFKEPAQDNRVYAQWWRSGIDSLYQGAKFLMIGWARSGDRRLLDAVRRFNRWQVDFKITHSDGGREKRRAGYLAASPNHFLPSWRGGKLFPGYDTEFATGPALEYLFCDNRWNKDALELMKQAVLRDFSPDPRTLTDSPDMSLAHMIGLYRVLPGESLRKVIDTAFATFTDVNSPIGMKESYWKPFGGHYTADYKLNRKALAIAEYAAMFGGAQAREIAAKAARASYGYKGEWTACNYCDFYGASNAMAHEWNRSPDHLKAAEYQLATIQKLFAAYRKLPLGETLAAHFVKALYPRCGHCSGSSYTFPEVPDNGGKPGLLAFGLPATGVPYLSVPAAVWALQGRPNVNRKP